jgi:Ni,Fe-hydrogenase III large subunit
VISDLASELAAAMLDECARLEREIGVLRAIYDEHAGLQDRFRGCGIASRDLATKLGLPGLAGRASGIARDLRRDLAIPPYDVLEIRIATRSEGDVAARVAVRFDEVIVDSMPDGPVRVTPPDPPPYKVGVGYVEGWRGPVFVALECGPDGSIRRCHPHDPSWSSWPVLEHAVIGNIVPDFPLINKSFNLSYSGHDL